MIIVTTNRRAHFDYQVEETYEAGLVLKGDEVKSIRAKQVSLNDAFATFKDGELFLINCHIAPYSHAYSKEDTSRQSRKLLLRKKEITKLIGAISRKGLTIIPLKLYFTKRGYVKLELGIARHRKAVNKKTMIKERDIKRETQREAKIKLR
ncbi:SsrA-binding protein SmpB [bacterium]|nr:SsrA-binding protein SmpB [bacterium]